jgi:hypothetical protein
VPWISSSLFETTLTSAPAAFSASTRSVSSTCSTGFLHAAAVASAAQGVHHGSDQAEESKADGAARLMGAATADRAYWDDGKGDCWSVEHGAGGNHRAIRENVGEE